jgi:uncharacterized protein YdhG (YjbR/CyaY superfamily)
VHRNYDPIDRPFRAIESSHVRQPDSPPPDLPAIGSPATRALAAAGITTLEQVRQLRAADLLAMHGVGPKAIAMLRSALADRGATFRDDTQRQRLPDDVRAYVDALDLSHRRLFDRLQDLVLSVVPDAEIVISYQIPLYRVGSRHVGLNAGRADGVTLTTTSPAHIEAFRRRHPQFKTNKASIRFGFDDELPDDDIKDVVRRATSP